MSKEPEQITIGEELHICPDCGYEDGFHTSFVRQIIQALLSYFYLFSRKINYNMVSISPSNSSIVFGFACIIFPLSSKNILGVMRTL